MKKGKKNIGHRHGHENGSLFKKWWHRNNNVIFLPELSPTTKPKWTVVASFSNSSGLVWKENISFVFILKPPFSNFSNEVQVDGAGLYRKCLTHYNTLNRYICVIICDYKVAHAIFSHKPFTEEDILTFWAIQIYRVNLCPNKRSSMISWSWDSPSHMTSQPLSQGLSSEVDDNCFLWKVSEFATLQNLHTRILVDDLRLHVAFNLLKF